MLATPPFNFSFGYREKRQDLAPLEGKCQAYSCWAIEKEDCHHGNLRPVQGIQAEATAAEKGGFCSKNPPAECQWLQHPAVHGPSTTRKGRKNVREMNEQKLDLS